MCGNSTRIGAVTPEPLAAALSSGARDASEGPIARVGGPTAAGRPDLSRLGLETVRTAAIRLRGPAPETVFPACALQVRSIAAK